jgi:hypothetical protein
VDVWEVVLKWCDGEVRSDQKLALFGVQVLQWGEDALDMCVPDGNGD